MTHEFSASFNQEALGYLVTHFGPYKAIIDKHTLWPYYSMFMDTEEKVRTRTKLRENTLEIIPFQYANYNRCLMLCPKCVWEDRCSYGEAYFHVQHQFWDSKACYRHKCKLIRSDVRIGKTKVMQLVCAEECLPGDMVTSDCSKIVSDFAHFQYDFYKSDDHNAIPNIVSAIISSYTDLTTKFLDLERLSKNMEDFYLNLDIGRIPINILDYFLDGHCSDTRLICLLSFFLRHLPHN